MEDKDKEEYFLEHQQCGGSGLLSISVKMMSRTIWKRSQSRGPRPKIEEKEKLNYILRRLGDLSICIWCECLQNAVFGCIHIAWCSHSQTRQYSKRRESENWFWATGRVLQTPNRSSQFGPGVAEKEERRTKFAELKSTKTSSAHIFKDQINPHTKFVMYL